MARTDTLPHFLTDVADAIREKTGSQALIQASSFDTEISNISGGGSVAEAFEKDVNFYDHTGFIWYSYTTSEFLALESMPANPSIDGLTAQGWNWSFADAKDYVQKYSKLDIGQMYKTSDNSIKVYIRLNDGKLSPTLIINVQGTATIDWGDNSEINTISGYNIVQGQFTGHTYSKGGDYVIKVTPADSNVKFGLQGTSNGRNIICGGNDNVVNNRAYNNSVYKIEMGDNVERYSDNCFTNLTSLESVTLSRGVTSLPQKIGYYVNRIKCFVIPDTVTSLGDYFCASQPGIKKVIMNNNVTTLPAYMFSSTQYLSSIIIPSSVTTLSNGTFYNIFTISSVIVPKRVMTIGDYTFGTMNSLMLLDFSNHEQIPTISNTTFQNLNSDAKIIVPDDLYDDWIVASNWSTYASQIISKSNYYTL